MVKILLDSGIPFNIRSVNQKKTTLMVAADQRDANHHVPAVKLLLEAGANPNVKLETTWVLAFPSCKMCVCFALTRKFTSHGKTAYDYSAEMGRENYQLTCLLRDAMEKWNLIQCV
jgi:ankyrin repeat protein